MIKRAFNLSLLFAFAAALNGPDLLIAADDATPAPAPARHYRAKQLLGAAVSIEGDASVGTVDDIVLDNQGNVDYLIVGNDEGKLVTVPWDATQFSAEKRTARVRIAPKRFREIPTYSVQEYPLFSTPNYREQVYQYYGLTVPEVRRQVRKAPVAITK